MDSISVGSYHFVGVPSHIPSIHYILGKAFLRYHSRDIPLHIQYNFETSQHMIH